LKTKPPFFNSYIIDTLDETKKYKVNIDFITREDVEDGVNKIVAKLIRQELKKTFPNILFQVKKHNYINISVNYTDDILTKKQIERARQKGITHLSANN
jgi:hypothetical protein